MVNRNTWRYVRPTSSTNPVPFVWVFKLKQVDSEGKEFLGKFRCCLRGDRQRPYVNYNPDALYAPVASHESIRLLLAVTADKKEAMLEGADIGYTFRYGEFDIIVIMQQPNDSIQQLAKPGFICKLFKSLYGTRQAGEI